MLIVYYQNYLRIEKTEKRRLKKKNWDTVTVSQREKSREQRRREAWSVEVERRKLESWNWKSVKRKEGQRAEEAWLLRGLYRFGPWPLWIVVRGYGCCVVLSRNFASLFQVSCDSQFWLWTLVNWIRFFFFF